MTPPLSLFATKASPIEFPTAIKVQSLFMSHAVMRFLRTYGRLNNVLNLLHWDLEGDASGVIFDVPEATQISCVDGGDEVVIGSSIVAKNVDQAQLFIADQNFTGANILRLLRLLAELARRFF